MNTWPNHDAAWREWREAIRGNRMHHGWLLAGKAGLGKHDFALAAARELVAEDGISQPKGDHPDIIVLTHLPKDDKEERKREEGKPFELKRNISVTQIRAMQQRLTTRPTLGQRRAIIIDPADDMERGASNALLKSLEEPPVGTYFLLLAHRPSGLLPTIRSRCRMLRFPELSPADMMRWLEAEMPAAGSAEREAAVALAGGSLGAARKFLELQLGTVAQVMQRIVHDAGAGAAASLQAALVEVIGQRPDRERIRAVLDLARSTLAQALPDAKPGEIPGLIEAHGALVELTAQAPTYNFDPGLLVGEIASLLARAAGASEPAHG